MGYALIRYSAGLLSTVYCLPVYVLRKRVNLSSESSQPTQERQRGVKALLATEGTLVPQRSLKFT